MHALKLALTAFSTVLLGIATTTCFAATNLDSAILVFPEISAQKYRPDLAVACANTLISAGADGACAALGRAARTDYDFKRYGDVDEKICHLCRLLFIPRNRGQTLRSPRLGSLSLMPQYSMESPEWPNLPFAVAEGVPLSMNLGYIGSGVPESAEQYLSYCRSNGTFRVEPFPTPSQVGASNALQQVFSSAAWKALRWKDEGLGWSYTLNEDYAKERLWKQVENMVNAAAPPR